MLRVIMWLFGILVVVSAGVVALGLCQSEPAALPPAEPTPELPAAPAGEVL